MAEPMLRADKPWEGRGVFGHHGFLYDSDEHLFKIWYLTDDLGYAKQYPELRYPHRRAYAYSKDCREWVKPALGVVPWNENVENNLIEHPPAGGDGITSSVVKDIRTDDAQRRYITLGIGRSLCSAGQEPVVWYSRSTDSYYVPPCRNAADVPISSGLELGYSPDGVRWHMSPESWVMSGALVMDGVVLHGWDDRLSKWILWMRARSIARAGTLKYRTQGVAFAEDLQMIPFPEAMLAPDESDPPGVQYDRFSALNVPGGYAGLLTVMHTAEEEGFRMEPRLVFSRDARVWTHPAGRGPYIPVGSPGSWDDMYLVPFRPVCVGDTVYIPYAGRNTGNGLYYLVEENGAKRTKSVDPADRYRTVLPDGRPFSSAIGLATLPRDRWAALEPVSQVGALLTKPLYFAQNSLRVNADACRGSLRAEITDPLGYPVQGFTLEDSDQFCGDSFDHVMTWHGRSDLTDIIGHAHREGVPGRVLAIRFYLDGARLYSFSC